MEKYKVHYYFTDSEEISYVDTFKAKDAESAKNKLLKQVSDFGDVVVTLVEPENIEVSLFKELIHYEQ